jgi:aerobic-type carbon monoxide dehydrogenase small subunit (CoxS/CutS family)
MSNKQFFTFNGQEIEFEEGQSIAAALINCDKRELRSTRFGKEPRSIFCGIGICFDCIVVINGVGNQRSCLIEAHDGMKVESGE